MDNMFDCCNPCGLPLPPNAELIIPESFEECFTYAEQILWLKNYVDSIDPSQAPELDDIKNRLANVEASIGNINGDITGIQTELADIKRQLTSITANATEQAEQISALQTGKQNKLIAGDNITLTPQQDGTVEISSRGGSEVTLDDTVTQDSTNGVKSSGIYTAIQAAKTEVQGNVDTVSQTVAEHTADLADIDRDIQQLQTSQTAMGETVSGLQTTVTQQGTDLNALKQTVQEQDGDITALDQKSTQHEKDIQQAKTDIEANKTNINVILGDYVKDSTYEPFVTQTNTTLAAHAQHITDLDTDKQNKLIAGDNITLTPQQDGTVEISAAGGGGGGSITLDDTVTADSANAVKSSGIYSAIIEGVDKGVSENLPILVTLPNFGSGGYGPGISSTTNTEIKTYYDVKAKRFFTIIDYTAITGISRRGLLSDDVHLLLSTLTMQQPDSSIDLFYDEPVTAPLYTHYSARYKLGNRNLLYAGELTLTISGDWYSYNSNKGFVISPFNSGANIRLVFW